MHRYWTKHLALEPQCDVRGLDSSQIGHIVKWKLQQERQQLQPSTNDSCNAKYLPPSACSINGHHKAVEPEVEWLFRLSSGSEGIMRFSQSSAILGNRYCKKKERG